jgi:putative chitinase
MSQLSVVNLLKIAPGARNAPNLDALAAALNMVAGRFGINHNPRRLAYFVSQTAYETADFTKLEENLFYTDPARVAQIFKYGFDLDRDGVVDPEEVEFAKGYIRNPQKLANRAYALRFGNRDEASGDGWLYRGSGFMHTTFFDNFMRASMALFGDDRLVRQPELLRDTTTYECAALTAGQFWADNNLNQLADADQFTRVTKVINGSERSVPDRIPYLRRANALVL